MFRSRRETVDFSAEIEAHLQLESERLREQGLSEDEARAAARRAFGNITQAEERFYEARRWLWLDHLVQDIRFSLRMLAKSPGFTAVATLTLALGIGANTAIFSLIDSAMLKMLPVQKPEELLLLATRSQQSDREPDVTFSNPVWEQIRKRQDVFSSISVSSDSKFDLARGGESHNVNGLYVSGEFFNTLGVRPVAGRLLLSSDDFRSCPGAAVLSYGFWQEHYGGAPSAIGSMISLNNHPFEVIGVTSPGFFGVTVGERFDVAVPVCAEAVIPVAGEPDGQKFLDRPSAQWLRAIGRPKPGVGVEQIRARLQVLSSGVFAATVSPDWRPELQAEFLGGTLVALPGRAGLSALEKYNEPLKMLMIVVGLVLLIACASIASLMLARASARRKEIAVRLAMGAPRSRIVRQLLTECILLSSLGALLGIFLARWSCALLLRFISTSQNRVILPMSLDGRILAFTAGMAVLTGLLFGLLPALRSARVSLISAMKGAQASEAQVQSRSDFRSGHGIVVSQVALSLVLLMMAGLFLRSFKNLLTLDLGFDRSNVLLVETSVPQPPVPAGKRSVLYRQILERLNALPGANSVSESLVTPISGELWGADFYREKGGGPTGDDANAYMNFVSPGYFANFRTPLLAGRNFDDRDLSGAQRVIIINESMARRFFPHSQAIGQYLLTDDFINGRRERMAAQIIGIVKDTKYKSLREATPSIVYFPLAQSEALSDPPAFEIRSAAQPSSLVRAAEEAIGAVNKNISLNFRTLESRVDDSLQQDRLLATLSGFFGGLALLLAMIGLYGVLAYMVRQRRKELGIRMALGAQKSSILRLVMEHVIVPLALGIAIGVGISLWATRLFGSMLFGLASYGAKTMFVSVVVLMGCALFAGYLPARRATRTDPTLALREE